MVYCKTTSTHSLLIDTTKGCVTACIFGDCDVDGSISCRRWWGDGSSLDIVSFLDHSIRRAYKREGEAGTSLVYQV
jgi:hypothetical protein